MVHKSLKEVSQILGFKDIRSTKKWCETRSVRLLRDKGCKGYYVIESEFEQARLKTAIQYLKSVHGANWINVFKSYMNLNLINRIEIRAELYKPSGSYEKEFLSSLTVNESGI